MWSISIGMVLVAALANFFIGFMFHGPIGGKLWMKLANIVPTGNERLSDMWKQMVGNYLVNVVFAYVLAVLYMLASTSPLFDYTGATGGMIIAFLVWLGFCVTGSSMDVIWMGKSWKLWLYELGTFLVSVLAMGAIIGAW